MGYAVARSSLLSLAEHVTIASSSPEKVANALERLRADPELQRLGPSLQNRIAGDTLDIGDTKAVGIFFQKIGEIDHLVITSGDATQTFPWRDTDLEKYKG